jgi:hypothetical protein
LHRGTSLSEVLISTLVMSIGVVALASLFPISVLRSIQASQLTNAASLRYNAEALMKTVPQLTTIGEEWQPVTAYQQWDTVIPPPVYGLRVPAVFICEQAGTSGGADPGSWGHTVGGTQAMSPDGTVTWRGITLTNYIVDPLGYVLVDPADADPRPRRLGGGALTGAQQHFGNVGGAPFLDSVNRFPAYGLYQQSATALVNEARAAAVSVLPDSWTLQAESLDINATTITPTSIILGGVDFNDLSQAVQYTTPDLVPDRIVLMDETNRRGHMRAVTGLTSVAGGTQVSWAAGQPLPTGFSPVRARVESLERRYSYVLSARRRSGAIHTDVVVFFRRSFGLTDEQVYSCVFRKIDRGTDGLPGDPNVDDNGDGTNDDRNELGMGNDKPRNFVIVQYYSSNEKPFYKKGGFICDAQNLKWYRIIDVYEPLLPGIGAATPAGFELDPVANDPVSGQPNNRFVRLTLNREIEENSRLNPQTSVPLEVQNGTFVAAGTGGVIGGAILIRGVVDVFPLRALR